MLTGNTETGITVTYQDADGTIDFEVDLLDEDDFASDSDTKPASQQSIKAYIAANTSAGSGTTGGGSDQHFLEMDQVITTSYQITANKNAMSVSPSLNSGVVITVPSGATWVVH